MKRKDLTGMKFGRLTVLEFAGIVGRSNSTWKCKCECGNIKTLYGHNLTGGITKSCGCFRKEETAKRHPRPNLLGKTFGRLTVIASADVEPIDLTKKAKWLCKCSCGNEKVLLGNNLSTGHTTSCGCICQERMVRNGLSTNPIYGAWRNMLRRCYDETNNSWARYGGRGIKVCDEWKDDFLAFYEWAKDKYKEGLEIDRINNDGDYEPSNCRFIDDPTNASNKNIRADNKTGYIGVNKISSTWDIRIAFRGKNLLYRSGFSTAEEAAIARDEFIKAHNLPHKLNFPDTK